jgi:hypothetical protein
LLIAIYKEMTMNLEARYPQHCPHDGAVIDPDGSKCYQGEEIWDIFPADNPMADSLYQASSAWCVRNNVAMLVADDYSSPEDYGYPDSDLR